MFEPPSREGAIVFPGLDGGAEWGGAAVDPETATPAVCMVDGKQYVVIACGGGKLNTRSGDANVAFALK